MTISASEAHQATIDNMEPISIAHYVDLIDIEISKATANGKFKITNVQLFYGPGDRNITDTPSTIIDERHMEAIQTHYRAFGYVCGSYWDDESAWLTPTNDFKCWYIKWKDISDKG